MSMKLHWRVTFIYTIIQQTQSKTLRSVLSNDMYTGLKTKSEIYPVQSMALTLSIESQLV